MMTYHKTGLLILEIDDHEDGLLRVDAVNPETGKTTTFYATGGILEILAPATPDEYENAINTLKPQPPLNHLKP